MKKTLFPIKLTLSIYFLLAMVVPTIAQERMSTSELRRVGILTESFQPILFSHNDKWLVGFDRAPFEEKKAGVFFRLWFFEIQSDGKLAPPRKVPLELASFQQGEFTPNDDAFVVMGNRGNTFLKVSLKDFQVSPLMVPSEGKAGFRSEPTVLWTEAGRLYTVGYPYDEARFINARTVATINPDLTGAAAFTPGPDVSTLEKSLERLWFSLYLSPKSAFFGQKFSDTVVMSHWDGESAKEFDRAAKVHGSWANADRFLYSVERGDTGKSELLVYDAQKKERKVLGSGDAAYRYLFLSRDGQTAVASIVVPEGRRLSTFFAGPSTDWKLEPIDVDSSGRARTIPSGWIRVSSKGAYLAHISSTGLTLYDLKSPR